MKRLTSIALSLLLLILPLVSLLSSCSIPGNNPSETAGAAGTEGDTQPHLIPSDSSEKTVTPDAPAAAFDSGVSVEMSPYLVREDTALSVTEMQPVEVTSGEFEGFRLTVYDITMGERHEFNEYFTIRLPYDPDYLEAGQDPCLCVTARWHNPETDEWEAVLYSVDTEKHELVIRTDHLSEYGCFEIKNEGTRKARVAYVKSWMMYELFDVDTACDVLSEYNASKGTNTAKAATLGAKLVNKAQPFANAVSGFASEVGALDNILRLGDSEAGLVIKNINVHQKTVEVIGKVGIAASCVKLAIEICQDDQTRDDIISIYKDAVSLTLDLASASDAFGSATLSVGLAGVWIFDQVLTKMVDTAKATRMELFGSVYTYYNDTYSGYGHKARTDNDWRDIMIAEYEKSKGDTEVFSKAMEKQMSDYADKFWTESNRNPDLATELMDDMGITRLPLPMGSEIDALKKQYINNLQVRINALIPVVRDYYQEKTEDGFEKSLETAKKHLNTVLTCTMEDTDKQFTGCTVRFAELSDIAMVQDWQGTMPSTGSIKTSFTVLGYYLAGCPERVEVLSKEDGKTVIGFGQITGTSPQLTVTLSPGQPETQPAVQEKIIMPTKAVKEDGSPPDTDIGSRRDIVAAVINQLESPCIVYDPATMTYSFDIQYAPNDRIIPFGSENGLGTEGESETYRLEALSLTGTFSTEKKTGEMQMSFVIYEDSYSIWEPDMISRVRYTFSNESSKFNMSYDTDAGNMYLCFYGTLLEEWYEVTAEGAALAATDEREDHREYVYLSFRPVE